MTSSQNNIALVTAAGVAATAAMFLAVRAMNQSSSPNTNAAEPSPEDCIQPDDVVAVFNDLFLHMQSVVLQLSKQIQQIQMAGQSIPEPQLRQLLKAEFERALTAKQTPIYEKHDVDADCLEEATWEFMEKPDEYPTVKKAVERFQKLYEDITGEKVIGRRPGSGAVAVVVKDISKEKLLEAAEVYFDALTSAMVDIVKKLKADGKDLNDPMVAQQFHMKFAEDANQAGEKALDKEGVTIDTFKAAVDKYSSDMEVQRALAMMQIKQQNQLAALGVKTA